MRFRVHTPGRPLDRFVDFLWSLCDAPSHARERIFPSGTVELVINLAEDDFQICRTPSRAATLERLPGAMVSGCYKAPFEFDTRAHSDIIGVHFKPAGAVAFLGLPAGEISDTHVALEDVWGRDARELRERLCAASTREQRFHLLENALAARLVRGRDARPAVAHALRALERRGMDVGDVARDLGLSRRRLIEIFAEDVGMTPKRYARVRRFQRVLSAATSARSPHWSELALEHGYYDQAHLCREWGELTGVSPTELVALRQGSVKESHLAVPQAGSNPSKTRHGSEPRLGCKEARYD